MRKITGLCIIVALLVSIFDIIDVNDITLNGKEIFTTDNACAQHNDDDLNDTARNILRAGLPFAVQFSTIRHVLSFFFVLYFSGVCTSARIFPR